MRDTTSDERGRQAITHISRASLRLELWTYIFIIILDSVGTIKGFVPFSWPLMIRRRKNIEKLVNLAVETEYLKQWTSELFEKETHISHVGRLWHIINIEITRSE